MRQRTEQEIKKNWQEDTATPIVSICCTTYNHEPYIAEAIEGFLMQETTFPFEILIRDDCSTDRTASIVKEYADKYPTLINPIYEKENTFSKGVRPMTQLYKIANGKYIALCEGDDYWTDPLKLQKQVTLLKKYPEAMMSIAYTDLYNDDNGKMKFIRTFSGNDKELQGFDDINSNYFHTSTYLVKTERLKKIVDECFIENITFSDTVLRYMLIIYGPFVLLPEVVSVYRSTGKGIWSSLNTEEKSEEHILIHKGLLRVLKGKYRIYQGTGLFHQYHSKIYMLMKKGQILDAIFLLPQALYYGIFHKVPNKLRSILTRKFKR